MNQIVQYIDIGFLVLFILLVVGLVFAALRGFRRGVWKSTHNMIFMLSLVFIAFFTLGSLTDFVGSFQLSTFIKGSFYLSRDVDGTTVTYYVPITTIKETLNEFIKGFYAIYNVSVSSAEATNMAMALATSLLKVVIFIVDMILIITLGNLFSFLSWYLIFRHFIPRIAKKTIKMRWLGLIETVTTFVVVTALFFTPFTSLLNSVNQSYQRNKQNTNSEIVQNVGGFIDAYNKSLFAKVLFNWTVDQSGMTFDTRLFDSWTTGVSGGYSVGIVSEIANIANTIATCAPAVNSDGSEITFDFTSLITQEIVDQAFDTIMDSKLIANLLPIAMEVVFNSDLLEQYIPTRLIDLSDVNWRNELGYVRDMVDCVFASGAIDRLFVIDDYGKRVMRSFQNTDLYNFIEEVVTTDDEHFDHVLDIFKKIDESKVLSRAVPALLNFLIESDQTGTAKQYLPYTWEELNEFSWGFESYVLLDFLHSTIKLDDDFLKAIFISSGLYAEDPSVKKLETLISKHADAFKNLLVGEFVWNDSSHSFEPKYPNRLDKNGRTIVFDAAGNRKDDDDVKRHYCFFDMNLVNKSLPNILYDLFEIEGLKDLKTNMAEGDLDMFHQEVTNLSVGNRLLNYKSEFYSVLDVVATLGEDEQLIAALMTGKGLTPLMAEENNFFSIDISHVNKFKQAIAKMDRSKVLYATIAPMLKSSLGLVDVANVFTQIGLDHNIVISAISHDMQATNHTLFSDFSDLLDCWSDLNNVYNLSSITDQNALMDQLKTPDGGTESPVVRSLINILNTVHENKLINPTPQSGDTYEKNANLYGFLNNIFSMTQDIGLVIKEETIRSIPDNMWSSEFEAIGSILTYIADHDIINASSAFSEGLTRTNLTDLRSGGRYDIPQLFTEINGSILFSSSFGEYLDGLFGDALSGFLIDSERHITFSNVNDWAVEGQNIGGLLDSFYDVLPENDAEAQTFLQNFELSKFTNVVELNAMLHDLAHSGIFTYVDDNGDAHYQFGKWLYSKVESSMASFPTSESTSEDLFADPTFTADSLDSWKVSWGIRPEDSSVNVDPYFQEWKNEYGSGTTNTHYIAYRDFANPNGIDDIVTELDHEIIDFWCDYDTFKTNQNNFLTAHRNDLTGSYTTNAWGAYFASDTFISDYGSGPDGYQVFEVDEISRIVKFLTYSMKLMVEKTDHTTLTFNDMTSDLLGNLLKSINETHCFRVCLYNFYDIAKDLGFDSYSGFSLESAYTSYMIDADYEIMDFAHAQPARQAELDKLVAFYGVIKKAEDLHILDGGSFQYDMLNTNNFMDDLGNALKGFNNSYVFHRKGSSKQNQLSTFQGLFKLLLGESDAKDIIYLGNDSPKDYYYINQASPRYTDATSKVQYLIETIFLDDAGIANKIATSVPAVTEEELRQIQTNEVDNLLGVIDKLYSLTDSSDNPVSNIVDADLTKASNSETITDLLDLLNGSNLLYDIVPNAIYQMFVTNSSMAIDTGSGPVDFSRIDPFYHYYFNLDNLEPLVSPNFEARYKPASDSNSDLKHLSSLLTDYQNFNDALGSGDITDKTVLLGLIDTNYDNGTFESNGPLPILLKEMHDCHLFHTPARFYSSGYYTSKFENGYTLFEEMMSNVCSSIGLDAFAFDASYDVPNGFNDANEKLYYNIKQVSASDDGQPSICVYHSNAGQAWHDEIDALMHLAYTACEITSNPSVDISAFSLDTLSPTQVKDMLTTVNYSNLVCDALPMFVQDGFEAINFGTLTTYNTVNYANYRIGQVGYGGVDGGSLAGSEIDNIYNVLTALRNDDVYVNNMADINTFVTNDTTGSRLKGLIRFIYESRLLNTPVGQNYQTYYQVSGHQISAQGVILYNIFDASGLSGFIARDALTTTAESTDLDKIEQLSTIVHMPYEDYDAISEGLTYEVEASGLRDLIIVTKNANIDASSFTGAGNDDISAVHDLEGPILSIVNYAYDADGEGHRSAIVSELVSGLLNNVLENEYNGLSEKVGYAYNEFTFGKPASAPLISFSHYSDINVIEKNGLQGILDSLTYIDELSDPVALAGMTDEDRHELADNLEACFALMTTTIGTNKYNSEIGRIVYLNDVHQVFKLFAAIPNSEYHNFSASLVDETSTSTAANTRTVYSENFYFSAYGTAFKEYIYPGFF